MYCRKLLFISIYLINIQFLFSDWEQIAPPSSGNIEIVIENKENNQIIYAINSYKAYKSIDGGDNWDICLEGSLISSIFQLAPSNQNVIYTKNWKSDDSGESWYQISIPHNGGFGIMRPKIAIDPINENIVFASDYNYIYKSIDGGINWIQITNIPVNHIIYDDVNSSMLFAFNTQSVYKSVDDGNSWENIYSSTGQDYFFNVEIFQQEIFMIKGSVTTPNRLMKSIDHGESWADINFTTENYNYSIITDIAVMEGKLLVTTDKGLFQSIDDGENWIRISSDYDYLRSIDVATNILIGSIANGVSISPLDEIEWVNIGVETLNSSQIKIITSNNGTTVLRSYRGLYKYLPSIQFWRTIVPPSGNYGDYALNFSKLNSNTLYCVHDDALFVSNDSGDTWVIISGMPVDITYGRGSAISIDESKQYFNEGSSIIRSLNNGSSWSIKSIPGNILYDIHYSHLEILYILDDTGMYLSTNNGDNWEALDTNFPVNYNIVENVISYDVNNDDRLFCSVMSPSSGNSDLYEKISSSNSWDLMYNNDDISFQDKIMVEPSGNDLYVSGVKLVSSSWEYGLLRSTNSGESWEICTYFIDEYSSDYFFSNHEPYQMWYTNTLDGLWVGDVQNMYGLSVAKEQILLPKFVLFDSYPNPFNPTATISYKIIDQSMVNISIYNMTGRVVASLVNSEKTLGVYSITWNASEFSSGLYFYKLTVGDQTITKKMLLIK